MLKIRLLSIFFFFSSLILSGQLEIKYGMSQRQGDRNYMEDYVMLKPDQGLFGIFDGHAGYKAAQTAALTFPEYLKAPLNKELIDHAFEQVDKLIKTQTASGTCAIIAHIYKNTLTLINLGDSRALVIRADKVIFETTDHKPNNPEERKRIESQGGIIKQDKQGTWRIANNQGSNLAVSRTLGDITYKEPLPLVSFIPDFYYMEIQPEDIIILASDGVWDIFKNEKVLQIIKKSFQNHATLSKAFPAMALKRNNALDRDTRDKGDLQLIARALRDTAYRKGSSDNLSVIVIQVKQ